MWRETARRVAGALSEVAGVKAVVLGGSHCTNTAGPHSDLDIGVYYLESFDIRHMDEVLANLDDEGRQGLLNAPGAWGKWINGGAWLQVDGRKTDILLREVRRVEAVIGDCQQGNITVDFQAGHPFGFFSAIYMGEVKCCLPLRDDHGIMAALKSKAEPVSAAFCRAASRWFLWEAGFSVATGRASAGKQDVVYAAGSLFKAALCITQALFCAHGEILLNEKGAVQRLKAAPFCPPGLPAEMEKALEGLHSQRLEPAFDRMDACCQRAAQFLAQKEEP